MHNNIDEDVSNWKNIRQRHTVQALLNCFVAFLKGSHQLARFLYDTVGDRVFNSKQDCILRTILDEFVQFLWDHTNGVPISGKDAKCKEYRFQVLEGKKPTTFAAETIKGITKSFHWKSTGKPNHVIAPTFPFLILGMFDTNGAHLGHF